MTNNDKNTQNMIETNEKKERNKLFSNFPPRQEFRQESYLKSEHFLVSY